MKIRCAENIKHELETTLDIRPQGSIVSVYCTECKDILLLQDGRSWWGRKKYPIDTQWLMESNVGVALRPIEKETL